MCHIHSLFSFLVNTKFVLRNLPSHCSFCYVSITSVLSLKIWYFFFASNPCLPLDLSMQCKASIIRDIQNHTLIFNDWYGSRVIGRWKYLTPIKCPWCLITFRHTVINIQKVCYRLKFTKASKITHSPSEFTVKK